MYDRFCNSVQSIANCAIIWSFLGRRRRWRKIWTPRGSVYLNALGNLLLMDCVGRILTGYTPFTSLYAPLYTYMAMIIRWCYYYSRHLVGVQKQNNSEKQIRPALRKIRIKAGATGKYCYRDYWLFMGLKFGVVLATALVAVCPMLTWHRLPSLVPSFQFSVQFGHVGPINIKLLHKLKLGQFSIEI